MTKHDKARPLSKGTRSQPTPMRIPGGQSSPPSDIPQQPEDMPYLSSSACSEMTMAGSFPGSAYDDQYTSDPREAQVQDYRRKRKDSIQNFCPSPKPPAQGPRKLQDTLDRVDKVFGGAPATTYSYGSARSPLANANGTVAYSEDYSPIFSSGPAGCAMNWSPHVNHMGDEPQLMVVEDDIKEWDGQGKSVYRSRSSGKSNRRR